MNRWFEVTMKTRAPRAVILVRLLMGTVFLSEGVQKFLFPVALGAGRFAKIGFPYPEWTAMAVAFFEITCGLSRDFGADDAACFDSAADHH